MLAALRFSTSSLATASRSFAFAQHRSFLSLAKTNYTAYATASGAGWEGLVELDDGSMNVDLAIPKEMDGTGDGQNPDQLLALGYASCFLSALQLVAKNKNIELADSVKVQAAVSFGEAKGSGGFGISVDVTTIGADAALVHEAHTACPYSRLFAQGTEVKVNVQ